MILMEKNGRGFAIGRFHDSLGQHCSIQESSLADHDCIWLGRHDLEASVHVRMHLDADAVRATLSSMRLASSNTSHPRTTFRDVYGSLCVVAPSGEADGAVEMGIAIDFEGSPGETMTLSGSILQDVTGTMERFLESGSIVGRSFD